MKPSKRNKQNFMVNTRRVLVKENEDEVSKEDGGGGKRGVKSLKEIRLFC